MSQPDNHPYSHAVVVNGIVFVSGALSVDHAFRPVDGRRPALDAALANVALRLQDSGSELTDVVKLTYFVTDVSLRSEANDQFIERFGEPRPARTFVEVSALPYGASVEIDAVAKCTD